MKLTPAERIEDALLEHGACSVVALSRLTGLDPLALPAYAAGHERSSLLVVADGIYELTEAGQRLAAGRVRRSA